MYIYVCVYIYIYIFFLCVFFALVLLWHAYTLTGMCPHSVCRDVGPSSEYHCPILEGGGGPYILSVIHPACKFGTMLMHSVSFSHPCISPVIYFSDTGLSHVHPADGRG